MGRIRTVPDADADEPQRAVMERAKSALGVDFVPVLFGTMANAAGPAAGVLNAIEGVLGKGVLSGALKQTMMVAIAADRGCRYCAAVHSALCKMMGVPDEQVEAIKEMLASKSIDRDWGAVRFAVQAANRPQTIDDSDMARLRTLDFSDTEIAEISLVAGLGAMVCVYADAMDLEVDPQIAKA